MRRSELQIANYVIVPLTRPSCSPAGFGDRYVRILSVFGKRWSLWVYSFLQLAWAALFLLAVTPLYYDYYACLSYCCVLLLQILSNGGSFYSYKLKKLKSAEEKVKAYEGGDEDTEIINFFDEEEATPTSPRRKR